VEIDTKYTENRTTVSLAEFDKLSAEHDKLATQLEALKRQLKELKRIFFVRKHEALVEKTEQALEKQTTTYQREKVKNAKVKPIRSFLPSIFTKSRRNYSAR
jgi:hypothetical protein